jgi:hypothetical protein
MKQKFVELAATFENGQCLKLFYVFHDRSALLWEIATHSGIAVSQVATHDDQAIYRTSGIIGKYNLKALGNPPPIILSLAHYRWASTQALSWENQERMITNIQAGPWTKGKGPDAILASLGGDDIVGREERRFQAGTS